MDYDNIPQELKTLNQWVCYKSYYDKKENKFKKIIISPITNQFAKSNRPDTWDSFEHAKYYCKRHKYQGLAFALARDIVFIDIDKAIDKEAGQILSQETVALLKLLPNTFTEKSLSGTGIHILFKGNLPENALKRNDAKGLEMYDTKRFVCLTGNLIGGSANLADYSSIAEQINCDFIGKRKERTFKSTPCLQSDTELVEIISKSRQGAKFQRLYGGDTSGYESHSGADFALASILAWWTMDFGQIERIFRSSGLMRDKFDRRTGDSTYGLNLISAAMGNQTNHSSRRSNYQM